LEGKQRQETGKTKRNVCSGKGGIGIRFKRSVTLPSSPKQLCHIYQSPKNANEHSYSNKAKKIKRKHKNVTFELNSNEFGA